MPRAVRSHVTETVWRSLARSTSAPAVPAELFVTIGTYPKNERASSWGEPAREGKPESKLEIIGAFSVLVDVEPFALCVCGRTEADQLVDGEEEDEGNAAGPDERGSNRPQL